MHITIAVADDNRFLIQAIKEKLALFEELAFCFAAFNGQEIIEKIKKEGPVDLVLMDIDMPEMNGIEATLELKKQWPQIKVIMLTILDDHDHIFKAIQAGADGYLLKELDARDLHKYILETLEGGAAMSPAIAKKSMQLLRNPEGLKAVEDRAQVQLSPREVEVLTQLSQGLSYSDIAKNLHLSPKTIRNHIERIYKKLNVHSKLEAVQKGRRNFLI